MARGVEVDVFGIARGILPAKVADMPGRNILTFIDRHVGHISQIERRREHERLCPCDAPAVAFRHTHQFLPLGIVTVNALGEKRINADGIQRQCRRCREPSVLRAVDAAGRPHHARQLLERKGFGSIFTPGTAVLQRFVDRHARFRVGLQECDLRPVLHRGLRFGGLCLLPGRLHAAA